MLHAVPPTALLRRVAARAASHQGASTRGGKRFLACALGVGVEVIASHKDLAAGRIAALQPSRHGDGPIALRVSCADGDGPPAGHRCGDQEDDRRPRSCVGVVNPLAVLGRGSTGRARCLPSRHRLCVQAAHRHGRIVRLCVGCQPLCHGGHARGVRFRWKAPVLALPRRPPVCLSVRRTVASLTEATRAHAPPWRAHQRSGQGWAPGGGGPRRVARMRASGAPVQRVSTGGCVRSTRLRAASHSCATNRGRRLATVLVRQASASARRSSIPCGPSASALSTSGARRTCCPGPWSVLPTLGSARRCGFVSRMLYHFRMAHLLVPHRIADPSDMARPTS